MNRYVSSLLCAALLAACHSAELAAPVEEDPGVTAAVIQVRDRAEIIVDAVILNECSGELMQFHFNELVIAHDLEIVGRAFHAKFIQVDRGSYGIGLETGATYRQVGRGGSTFFISAKIDEVQTFVQTTSLIGTGGAPSARSHVTYHLTVGPSGKLVVEFDRARFTCG